MHDMLPVQSSDMVRGDSGNSIEDYKILQSATAFAYIITSSVVSPSSLLFSVVRVLFLTLADFSTVGRVGATIANVCASWVQAIEEVAGPGARISSYLWRTSTLRSLVWATTWESLLLYVLRLFHHALLIRFQFDDETAFRNVSRASRARLWIGTLSGQCSFAGTPFVSRASKAAQIHNSEYFLSSLGTKRTSGEHHAMIQTLRHSASSQRWFETSTGRAIEDITDIQGLASPSFL